MNGGLIRYNGALMYNTTVHPFYCVDSSGAPASKWTLLGKAKISVPNNDYTLVYGSNSGYYSAATFPLNTVGSWAYSSEAAIPSSTDIPGSTSNTVYSGASLSRSMYYESTGELCPAGSAWVVNDIRGHSYSPHYIRISGSFDVTPKGSSITGISAGYLNGQNGWNYCRAYNIGKLCTSADKTNGKWHLSADMIYAADSLPYGFRIAEYPTITNIFESNYAHGYTVTSGTFNVYVGSGTTP